MFYEFHYLFDTPPSMANPPINANWITGLHRGDTILFVFDNGRDRSMALDWPYVEGRIYSVHRTRHPEPSRAAAVLNGATLIALPNPGKRDLVALIDYDDNVYFADRPFVQMDYRYVSDHGLDAVHDLTSGFEPNLIVAVAAHPRIEPPEDVKDML